MQPHQLPRLNRILALKDLGFTLEQLAPLLKANLTAEQMREILKSKQAEIQRRMSEEQETLSRVEARLYIIEREGSMSQYEIVIKRMDPMRVAGVRETLPNYAGVGRLIGETFAYLESAGVRPAGPCAALWHDGEYKESDVDGTGCVPIDAQAKITGNERVNIFDLPAVETMACVIHHGSYSTLSRAYSALFTWADANGYKIVGDNREIYLQGGSDGSQTDESCVTEVQFAVAKA